MTLREALGGPWATHWLLWLAFYPATLVMVLVRESTTVYPEPWWPFASATLQHLVVGLVVVGGGALARRRWPILPVAVFVGLWSASAVVRAGIGSVIAEEVADVPGSFGFRMLSWTVVTIAWAPAVVYGIAQIGRRRALLEELSAAQRAVDDAAARAAESGGAMRARLAETVRRSVSPVLEDLRERLVAVRRGLDPAAFAEISSRLSRLHDETADLLESTSPTTPAAPAPARRASLRSVFDVHLAAPWLTASIVTMQTIAAVLPDGARIFGALSAIEIVLASVFGGIVLGGVMGVCNAVPRLRRLRASSVTLAACGGAILIAAWVMVHSGIDSVTQNGAALLPLLGAALVVSCTVVLASLVLARANVEDEGTLERLRRRAMALDAEHDAALERERHRLGELMHGPVQGRIAACVMALTFFSTADAAPGALDSITGQVVDHLAAASRDLALLAGGRPPNGGE